jgi:N-acetylneuraminic acid mutarotase
MGSLFFLLQRGWVKFALVAAFIMAALPAAHAQGKWESATKFPKPLEEVVGVSLGERLFVMAGLDFWTGVGVVYEYDFAGKKWIEKKKMPIPAHHVMATSLNGKIYVFGGFTQPGTEEAWLPVSDAWEYSPETDSWKALAPMPTPRGAGGAVEINGKIYVVGGANMPPNATVKAISFAQPHVTIGTLEEYDPATNTWRSRTQMPTPRNHFVAAAVNGKLYVAGGRTGAALITRSSNTNITEEYDPATDRWALRAPMPTARSGTAGGVYKGKIYVAGGEFQDDKVMMAFRAFETYDPATNSWGNAPRMRVPRHGFGGAIVGNEFHAVAGDIQSAVIYGILPYTDSHEVFVFD